MSKPSYQNFLSVLEHKEAARPTLFEPFINPFLAEQLIWRRGPQLWDTPEHYVKTMISLRERTQADVVILDARGYSIPSLVRLLSTVEHDLPQASRAVILCEDMRCVKEAVRSDAVCAIGIYGQTYPTDDLPFIRMDRTAEEAVIEGSLGWYAPASAETYYNAYCGRLTICGGLGADAVASAEPISIHQRIQSLVDQTQNLGYMIGSGGTVPASSYLSLISMLGIYIRNH